MYYLRTTQVQTKLTLFTESNVWKFALPRRLIDPKTETNQLQLVAGRRPIDGLASCASDKLPFQCRVGNPYVFGLFTVVGVSNIQFNMIVSSLFQPKYGSKFWKGRCTPTWETNICNNAQVFYFLMQQLDVAYIIYPQCFMTYISLSMMSFISTKSSQ